MSGITFTGLGDLIANVEALGQRYERAAAAVGELLAPKLEAYAKANASWTDRTGQARQGLTGLSQASADLVTVYLYHRSDHGKWLEIAHGGPYRIIIPTLTAHYGEAMALIAQVIGGR